jgi:phage terminase large subunit
MLLNNVDNRDTQLLSEYDKLDQWLEHPSEWVKAHINIDLAKYRARGELDAFLRGVEGHAYAKRNLKGWKLDSNASYQAEALDTMATPGFHAFQWANGCAKTTTAALWLLWFLDTHPGSKVVTTAGTWSQLTQQLWKEIHTWVDRSEGTIVKQVGYMTSSIHISADWFAIGRAATSEATFEGVHAQYVAVVMDEAKAIKPEIFSAVRRILRGNMGGKFWWIAMSSPGSPSGPFYDICQGSGAANWTVHKLSAYQSERVSLTQIEDDRNDLGENSPLFVAMDLGEFPEETEDTIIPITWVQAAVDQEARPASGRALAVDIARFGQDETVFMRIDGRKVSIVETYTGKDLMKTAGRIVKAKDTFDRVAIDDVGLGGGVTDRVKEMGVDGVLPLNAGMRSAQPDKYSNLGTQMMWALRQVFEENYNSEDGDLISIPNDKTLIHQLSARKFDITSSGQIKMETKGDMRKRGERSPDRADTLSMAWYARSKSLLNTKGVFEALSAATDHDTPGMRVKNLTF